MTDRYVAKADRWVVWVLGALSATMALCAALILSAVWPPADIGAYLAAVLLVAAAAWVLLLPFVTFYELRDDDLLIVCPPFRVRLRYDRIVSATRHGSLFGPGVNFAFSNDTVVLRYRLPRLPVLGIAPVLPVRLSPAIPEDFCRELEYRVQGSAGELGEAQGTR